MGVPINYLYGTATREANRTKINAVEKTVILEANQTFNEFKETLNDDHALKFSVFPASDAQNSTFAFPLSNQRRELKS